MADTPDLHLSLALIGWSAQVFSRHPAQWPTVGTAQVRPLCWCRSTARSESKRVQHGVGSASGSSLPSRYSSPPGCKTKIQPCPSSPSSRPLGPIRKGQPGQNPAQYTQVPVNNQAHHLDKGWPTSRSTITQAFLTDQVQKKLK